MDCIQPGPGCICHGFIDLVPGQEFVGGDVDGVTDGMPVAQQAGESFCKIGGVGHDPQRRAIAWYNHRFPLTHAVDQRKILPAPYGSGDDCVIGVRGTHNGDRESVFPVCLHQDLLTGNLIPRVLPVGIGQWGGFGDHRVGGRFLVGGGRTDENVLPAAAFE